jgi:RHS repeat-associated protein
LSYAKDTTTGSLKILEENNYYPFGLKHNSYNVDNFQPDYKYKFNGKELQDELSLNLYDYGARNYDPVLGRWMNMDPLAETSRRFSPYTYALNNPVYFIDPDGMQARYNWEEHDKGNKGVYTDDKTKENVSFETALAQTNANEQGGSNEPPKTIFVNGFLMFGDLKSGKDYWSKEFRQGARKYLSKNTEGVLDKYINYDPSILSSAKGRFNSGYDYAMNNYFDLISGMDKNKDYFNFVSHSMGSAFSEGIAKYMIEMGWKVGTSVHINAFQAADIVSQKSYSFKDQTKTIDYQNTDDPVINNSVRSSPGYIQGASLIIRVQSGVKAYDFIHASPISTGANFWSKISSIINH